MNLRLAKESDIDKILELGNSVEEFKVSKEVVSFWPKEILKNIIQDIIIAEKDNQIIGFSITNYNERFKKAILENIFVIKDYRGKGISKQLLDYTIEELKKKGCNYLCAMVEKENSASFKFLSKQKFNKGIECIWMDKILDENFKT